MPYLQQRKLESENKNHNDALTHPLFKISDLYTKLFLPKRCVENCVKIGFLLYGASFEGNMQVLPHFSKVACYSQAAGPTLFFPWDT